MIKRLSLCCVLGALLLVAATAAAAQRGRAAESSEEVASPENEGAGRGFAPWSIKAEGLYEFTEDKNGIYAAPGNTFISGLDGSPDNLSRNIHGYSHVSSGAGSLVVNMTRGVHLPNGSTVTSLTCRYYDNINPAGVAADFSLLRRAKLDTESEVMGEFSISSGAQMADTVQTSADLTILRTAINNFDFDYFLLVSWNPGAAGSDLRFYGCDIEYTYDYLSN